MIVTPIPLWLALSLAPDGRALAPTEPLRGYGIESRTASVLAGACHYGAEATTSGREALVAWHFEHGSHLGIDLAGIEAVAAIVGEANLADPRAPRRSILYVSDRAKLGQRLAVLDLLRSRFSVLLGSVSEERTAALRIDFDGEGYRIAAGDLFEIEGALLPDRACCKMPSSVWYEPLTPLIGRIVGRNDVFRYADKSLGPVWERFDENTAFAGTFEIAGDVDGLLPVRSRNPNQGD